MSRRLMSQRAALPSASMYAAHFYVSGPCGRRWLQRRGASVGEQMAEYQIVGQVKQRHHVMRVGPYPAFSPTPCGVAIGPKAARQL